MISFYADDTSRGDSAEHCQDKTTKTMMTKLFLMSYVKNSWTERKYVHIRATLPVYLCKSFDYVDGTLHITL